jgi:hypothetical protein
MAKKTIPYKINFQKLKSTLLSIKARFESNTIRRMKDIADMYSTGMKKALGMGHDSFVTKFNDPSKFTVEDILKLADITEVDKDIIWKKIVEEVEATRAKHDLNHIFPNSDGSVKAEEK